MGKGMARPQKAYSQEEKKEIERAYRQSKQALEQKRLLCLKLRIVNGYTSKEIAKITNYKESTVKTMISKYGKTSLEQFISKQKKMYSQQEKEELERAYRQSRQASEQKRLLCLKLSVVDGYAPREIAKITNYKETTVKIMISKYGKSGLEQFLYKNRPGNNRKLKVEEEKELLEPFIKLAKSGKTFAIADIHKAFEEKINKKVAISTVYHLLARHGCKNITPRSKHTENAK